METVRKWGLVVFMIALVLAFLGHTLQALIMAHEAGLERTWGLVDLGLKTLLAWLVGGGAVALIRRTREPPGDGPAAGP